MIERTGPGYFSGETVTQPGIAGCSLHAPTAFGLPVIVLRHSRYGFRSLTTPLTIVIWLAWARGESSAGEAGVTSVTVTDGVSTELLTTLIWLPAARGESSASAAKLVNVNAVTTAPRRRTLVFILFFSFWFGGASLRRRLVAIGLPRATENPAKKFARNLRILRWAG